jgi:MATE family multidrug resistance protein
MPEAIGVGVEILCWGIFYNMMAKVSQIHVIVVAVANSIVMLFIFFGIGLEQGCSVIVGNLIGAKKKDEIKDVFHAGMILIAINAILMIALFLIFKEFLVDLFFTGGDFDSKIGNDFDVNSISAANSILKNSFVWIAVYLGIENIRWLTNGILRAGGDTKFLLIAGVVNILVLMIFPAYLLMIIYQMPVVTFFAIWIFFAVASSIVSYSRFNQGKWHRLELTE